MSHKVFFILDPGFAGDLWSLSRASHVWLIKSPQNDAIARVVWDRETEERSPLWGVTTFDGTQDAMETFYSFLGTIDQHHDEYSAPEPWEAIHVIGFPMDSARLDRIAEELDVDAVVLNLEGGGFSIRRPAQQAAPADGASRRR